MRKLSLVVLVLVVGLSALFLSRTSPALAHEGRDVGSYHLVVGWRVEPAIVGVSNGAEVFITQKDDPNKKVEGAEKTLKLEVTFGDKTKAVKLSAAYKDPGHYVTNIIPTRAGDYTFHITGKIGDTTIDEKFTSADGKFSSVEPAGDVLFPDTDYDFASLQGQIDELKAQMAAMKGSMSGMSDAQPTAAATASK